MKLSNMSGLAVALAAATVVLTGCNGKSRAEADAMPRPKAYPRFELPAARYDTLNIGGVDFAINAAAASNIEKRNDGNYWITVDYQPVGIDSKLHLTLIPVTASTVQDIVDNRAERIALNLGSATPVVTEINPEAAPEELSENDSGVTHEFFGQMIEASTTSTPLQLLLTDANRYVINAAVYYPAMSAATRDSLSGQLQYLRADLENLLP